MTDSTFTFTARSVQNPHKLATFTIQDDEVAVQLGEALLEQIEGLFDAFRGDGDQSNRFSAWLEPAATGALQRVLKPIPLTDFEVDQQNGSLQITAWLRAGGLRLAPILASWKEVDNPAAAQAFAEEVRRRKEALNEDRLLPDPFDYWASWIFLGMLTVGLPFLWWRLLRQRQNS